MSAEQRLLNYQILVKDRAKWTLDDVMKLVEAEREEMIREINKVDLRDMCGDAMDGREIIVRRLRANH